MPKRKRSQIDFTDDVATRECMSPDTNGQSIDDYTVGWICALQEEYDSACRMLDEEFDDEEVDEADDNSYTFGRIGPHHVVVGCLPAGVYGTNSAACVARDMVRSFPRLRFALLVGIAGGLPTAENDVRLGDVVVSMPHGSFSGVVQYDMGKHLPGGCFQRTGYLNAPPDKLLGVLPVLRRRYNDPKQPDRIAEHVHRMDDMPDYRRPVTDCLYHADYPHQSGRDCSLCDRRYLIPRAERRGRLVAVHYGTIASGNSLIKDAAVRDEIARSEMKPLCFEMEAAGLMNSLPCLVIRGICDYADSHKNDIFHKYAALAAAAYARELLLTLKQSKVVALPDWVDEVRMSLSCISSNLQTVQSRTTNESLRRWLSPVDPSRSFNTATDSLMPGTGNWLLNNKFYKDWKDKPGSIWLHGPPGSGKTALTTLVINDCLGKLTNASNTLLYFYFDFADSERLTQEAMLRSIIWQLASTDPALRSLASLYKSCSNGQRQPSRQQMHELFAQMAAQRSDVFLVIDAIDECTEREQLLWFIRYFTIGPKINLHLCVSSRREKDIEERLQVIAGHNARIGLEKDLVNKDIQHYVRQRLDLDEGLGRWKRMPDIQKEIEKTIVRQADGMFLLAACQLDSVRDCLDLPMLWQTLARLPKTLEGYYSRILTGITNRNKLYVLKVLQWLVYAVRPLKVEEVIDVVAVQLEGDPAFDPRNRLVDAQDIRSICSALVKIEDFQETQLVRLSHMTVRDYLTSAHARTILQDAMEQEKANAVIATTCLRYVLHLEQHSTESCLAEFPLAAYAAQHWPTHAQVANDQPRHLRPLLKALFLRTKAFSKWAQLFSVPLPEWPRDGAFRWEGNVTSITDSPRLVARIESPLTVGRKRFSTTTTRTPLFYACFIGLASAVSLILETAADPNVSCDAYGGSPLEIASHLGHEAVVRELLAKGANPNRLGNNNHGSALQRAVFGGYEGIIHTLLAAGADPNLTPSSAHPTPIQAALSMGHEHIAILLLNHAADPDTHCGKYGSALQVSLMLDSAAVMQHLLAKGANPNLNNGQYGTALQIAAERGNVQAVRALLGKGACPSAYNTKFDSPLGQALYYSHADIIDLLLKAGAYLQPRECGMALEIAAYVGDQSMVCALLGNGLDVDCSYRGNYETALWMAASQGHVGIVQLLLTKTPACGITNEFLGLARESAAGGRHYDIVLLLEGAR